MQTVGLIIGNGIYERLIDLINCDALGPDQVETQSAEIRNLCGEARKAWASAAFSDSTELALKRYFSYQLRLVAGIADLVTGHQTADNGLSERRQVPRTEILLLLNHLVIYFGHYIDHRIDCPDLFKQHVVDDFSSKISAVCNWADDLAGSANTIGRAVTAYLKHVERSGPDTVFSFGEILFFIRFLNVLEPLLKKLAGPDHLQMLADQLLKLDFNHYACFDFLQSEIRQRLKGTPPQKRGRKIDQELRMLAYDRDRGALRYDFRWPRLGDMLSDWLVQEQKKPEAQSLSPAPVNEGKSGRMQVMLSVAQLAGLVRLFVREKIFGAPEVNDIFSFFTANFSSKRQQVFSRGNFMKEYYSISQVTAAELRDLLLRMVACINRDFFPVMVAVSLLIHCH